jgi:regulator of replication initiation timing
MNAMEKEMTRKLEEAFQEIEQLRQENAQLRKKLGIEVCEPKADYRQSGPTSVGPTPGLKKLRKPGTTEDTTRLQSNHPESAPIFPPKKR